MSYQEEAFAGLSSTGGETPFAAASGADFASVTYSTHQNAK
jgi:hypothetical protein